ncbi:hypothetical protein [Streptomyces spongiicola]|uniref:hypothetical protein n=1 Tax=Streptomyces spongiicola TaxID=1690221 RepID=UPI0011C0F995|nr:hypothetical protein [Streptomyces spongiicola]
MLITAENEIDMEIFLQHLGKALALRKARTTINLYVDNEDDLVGDAREAFTTLRSRGDAATPPSRTSFLTRLLRQQDPYMGCDLHLTNDGDRRSFSLLAHRVIGCESWVEGEQFFSASGISSPVWVAMGDLTGNDLVESARRAGATSLRVIDAES